MMRSVLLTTLLLMPCGAFAQLAVTVSPPKVVGQKAMVSMAMKNGLPEKIESARAVTFLTDGQGKMVGQSSQWVIGGTKDRPALEPDKTAVFNFVLPTDRATGTNLTAKVIFSQVILAGGKKVDPAKTVTIQTAEK